MMAARLRVRGLHKRFGPTQALAGVDLDVAPGEIHAVVGENGAGKSTLLRVLAGVLRADAGSMQLDGDDYGPANPAEARARGLAIIHQELALAPHLSVAQNLFLGREPRRGPWLQRRELRRRAAAVLPLVGRADLDPDRPVATLPPADRQLVEIARALSYDVRVLVLDEPTSSLLPVDVAPLLQRLRALAARGTAVLYVSHALEEVFAVADRYTVLRDGQSVATGAVVDIDRERLVAAMVGRELSQLYPHSAHAPGDVVLELDGLRGRRLPRAASLQLRAGEVLGIAGLVGAGRTELLRAVFGLDAVTAGSVRVLALDGPAGPRARWAQGMGFLSEDRKLEGLMQTRSLAQNLWLPVLRRRARCGVLAPRALERAASPLLQRFAVRCRAADQPVCELSGGNQQKVALARLLAADCDVLLLDEPTRGIDVGARAEIYAAIDGLRRAGKAVLLVSSSLPELLGVADRIAVVVRGELLPARAAADLDEHALIQAMTGGGVV